MTNSAWRRSLRSPTGSEMLGRILLVIAGIVFLILGDYLLGIIAIFVGLALLMIPLAGADITRR